VPWDENEFFRQATLRICGSLEIQKALWSCLVYVRDFIPADEMRLLFLSPDQTTVEFVASATPDGGSTEDAQLFIPATHRADESELGMPQVRVFSDLSTELQVPPAARALGLAKGSALAMNLTVEGVHVGILFLRAEGRGRYNEQHVRLLSLLREPWTIALANCLRYREVNKLKERLADDNRYLHGELQRLAGESIVGAEFGLKRVMELVHQVAPLVSPVMLLGETGTGKELIASAIHSLSPRRGGPLIKVNCGAIPQSLMDSELFGHEKGAFTGALSQRRGLFERAHGGTIFLDEIGELTPEAQIRLLRVLQEKEIERLGGARPIKVDIRVITATHRDLEAMVSQGDFREDLYFRLQVFPILIPPLRERINDVPALVQHFIHKKAREMGLAGLPTLAPGAMDQLMTYTWPGNVRELENAVERALIVGQGKPLTFPGLSGRPEARPPAGPIGPGGEILTLDAVAASHIRRVLEMTSGRVEGQAGAARLLKVNPSTLRKRMKKLGIPFGRGARRGRRSEAAGAARG